MIWAHAVLQQSRSFMLRPPVRSVSVRDGSFTGIAPRPSRECSRGGLFRSGDAMEICSMLVSVLQWIYSISRVLGGVTACGILDEERWESPPSPESPSSRVIGNCETSVFEWRSYENRFCTV